MKPKMACHQHPYHLEVYQENSTNSLLAHSWAVSDPEILEYRLVAGILLTLQGHFGELTFFQFFILIIKEEKLEIGKLRNVPTFSGVQLVDQIQEMFDQPTSRHRPSIQLMTRPSIFSISPVFFCFEKQRMSMDFPKKKKKRCFFCWHNFKRFRLPRRWTFAITTTSHGDGR